MTKRECIDYIYQKQNEAHKEQLRRIKNKTGNAHEAITECYQHCKQICKDNGYVDICFENLWNMAIHRLNKKNMLKAHFANS